jgi:hypothetical protein
MFGKMTKKNTDILAPRNNKPWVSDYCLTPNQQFLGNCAIRFFNFSIILVNYFFSKIWRQFFYQKKTYPPLPLKLNGHSHKSFVYLSSNVSAIFQLYHGEDKVTFLMRWWWSPLCTIPKRLVRF